MSKSNVIRINHFNSAADDLPTAIDFFTTYCRSRNLSPRTIEYYDCCLLAFRRFLDTNHKDITPRHVTPQTIREFLLDQMQKNSASTACHCHTTLCVFFGYLVRDGFLDSSPMDGVEKPKRRKVIIETFTLEQVESILTMCRNDFTGIRDRAMVLIMMDCGLRVSELVGLTLEDISWAEQTLQVLGKGDKERSVPFGNTAKMALTRYITKRGKLDTDMVFVNCYGQPLTRYSVRELIYRRGNKARITGVRCSPHTFRHTFAVHYLRNGGDVFSLQKLLGHTDLKMTRRYAELSQTDVQQKHRLYSPADRLQIEKETKGRKRMR